MWGASLPNSSKHWLPRVGRRGKHMLFTNTPLLPERRALNGYTVCGVKIGESKPWCHEIFLPVPREVDRVIRYTRADLTIGRTMSGRPRINRQKSRKIFMILSSKQDDTMGGSGYIEALRGQEHNVIAKGSGSSSESGQVGTWRAVVVEAHEGDVFRVTWSGHRYGRPSTFYVIHRDLVYWANQPDIEELYKKLNKRVPFNITAKNGKLSIYPDEWTKL